MDYGATQNLYVLFAISMHSVEPKMLGNLGCSGAMGD